MKKKSKFFDNAYDDVYRLGDGYKTALKNIGKFLFSIIKKTAVFIAVHFVAFFTMIGRSFGRFFKIIGREARQFFSEIKRARPSINSAFKEKTGKGLGLIFKDISKSFRIHKKFNRAVLSTIIPVAALAVLISFSGTVGGLTFAVDVFVNNTSVGIVKDENEYKNAAAQAVKRFDTVGSQLNVAVPVYKITLTTVNHIDDSETVCNNIISALSDKTISACGVFVNGEFLCAVKSSDTFDRVKQDVLKEYAQEYGYTDAGCTVAFSDEITTSVGLYPDNEKLWSAEKLTDYLGGNSEDGIEYTVKKDETLESILKTNKITEDELKKLNPELETSNIPDGSVLLIKKPIRNVSVKATVTYAKNEDIPYSTVMQYDNNFYVGTSMTIVKGTAGRDMVSYTDTYIDGELVDSKRELVRYNARTAVNELLKVGTKGVPVDEKSDTPVSPRLLKDQGGTFIWPAPDNCYWLSRGYNPYNSHYGLDIVSSDGGSCKGRRIVAVADGIVVMETFHYSWGYYIRVDHGSGVVTGYAHALEGSFRVNLGDYVKAGQQLSSIGTTGNSTGYHLHFEVWLDGIRVNPLPYVYSSVYGVSVKK